MSINNQDKIGEFRGIKVENQESIFWKSIVCQIFLDHGKTGNLPFKGYILER